MIPRRAHRITRGHRPLALLLGALVSVACREPRGHTARDAGLARPGARPVAVPVSPVAPDAGATPCPWRWSDATALTLDAPQEDPFEFDATCSESQLAVAWRSGASAAVTTRALRSDASWSAPSSLGDDVASLGRPYGSSTAVWVAWTTRTGALRSARVDGAVMRATDASPGLHATFRAPFVLYARGDHALVASTHRKRLADQVIVHRVSVGSAPPAGARIDDGALVVAASGAHPRLVSMSNVPRSQGGPWHLRGWRLDAQTALTLAAPTTEGAFGVMPARSATATAPLPVGIGRFEFTRTIGERSGALLFQTVLGAERGVPRVAWFASEPPTVTALPVAVTSLGSTFDAQEREGAPGAAEITWWGDQNALERATVRASGLDAPARIGGRLATEFAVYEAARNTRWVLCGSVRWRVTAARDGASVRVSAAREACEGAR